jgi:D-alanyl-lipoteichoic acid acyltransferase DltB (MBOAT superfamily)
MLFNSFEYFIFLPVVFSIYWLVLGERKQLQNIFILTASYFFYGWWSLSFLGLLVLSTLLDFMYGFGVNHENKKRAKIFLWLSVINNLGILLIFKYYNFFIEQFQSGLEILGISFNPIFLSILLPVGISFYTFHGMSYVFDIYNKKQVPIRSIVDYGVFVSFFPLLVAGPIERAHHLLPQIQKKRVFNYSQAVDGSRLILWGLFKKIVIADNLAIIADNVFDNYIELDSISIITGLIAFSFQIYGDFSGYSDIALGTAKLLGFELLSNFKFPYFSRSISEFWRRWHISLSSWFKDYLYIPLGGSRKGTLITIINTFIIFLISGFWHGAEWKFIAWGGIHAFAFLPGLIFKTKNNYSTDIVAQNKSLPSFKELFQILFTFSLITCAWTFFRASDISTAINILKEILLQLYQNPQSLFALPQGKKILLFIIPLIVIDWYFRNDERVLKMPSNRIVRRCAYFVFFYLIISQIRGESSFIYFQF